MDHERYWRRLEIATAEPDGLDRLMAGDTPAARRWPVTLPAAPSARSSSSGSAALGDGGPRRGRHHAAPRPARTDPRLHAPARRAAWAGPGGSVTRRGVTPLPVGAVAALPHRRPAAPGSRPIRGAWAGIVGRGRAAVRGRDHGMVDSRLTDGWPPRSRDRGSRRGDHGHPPCHGGAGRRRGSAWPARAGAPPAGRCSSRPRRPSSWSWPMGSSSRPRGWSTGAGCNVGGSRHPIGKMFFGGGLAYWVGPSPAVAGLAGRRHVRRLPRGRRRRHRRAGSRPVRRS